MRFARLEKETNEHIGICGQVTIYKPGSDNKDGRDFTFDAVRGGFSCSVNNLKFKCQLLLNV